MNTMNDIGDKHTKASKLSSCGGIHLQDLKINHAKLRVYSSLDNSSWLYTLSDDCNKCPYKRVYEIHPKREGHLEIETIRPVHLQILDANVGHHAISNKSTICEFSPNMGDSGVYNLTIDGNGSCKFVVDKEPTNIYLPLILFLSAMVVIFAGYFTTRFFYKKWKQKYKKPDDTKKAAEAIESIETRCQIQLGGFHAYRGLAVVIMLFANSGGGGYWWTQASSWNGIGLLDFVFPAFNWVMGACMLHTMRSEEERQFSRMQILRGRVWFAIKQFAVGVCLNSVCGPHLEHLRIMGILQRLGVAHLVIGCLYALFVANKCNPARGKFKKVVKDISLIKPLWVFGVALALVYSLIIYLVKVPGCPRGYFGPGGLHEMGIYKNCTGGISGYIDMLVFGSRRIRHDPPLGRVYEVDRFDTEGLLGCIPTIVQTIMGLQCAATMLSFTDWKERIKRWLIYGSIFGLIAGILCGFSKDDGWIPINRSLMSPSFIFFTSAVAFLVHGVFYFLIDAKQIWKGTPFVQCGKNALLIYIGHIVLARVLPWSWTLVSMNTHFLWLLKSTWTTAIWILLACYWDKIGFFFTI